MGLAPGGQISQRLYPDPYGVDVWNQYDLGEVFIHILDSTMWCRITGENPPPSPIRRESYENMGFGWLRMYDEHMGDIAPASRFAGLKPYS